MIRQKTPLSPITRDKGVQNLCGTTLFAAQCGPSVRAETRGRYNGRRPSWPTAFWFSRTLRGDLPARLLSALHQNGGSLCSKCGATLPHLRVLRYDGLLYLLFDFLSRGNSDLPSPGGPPIQRALRGGRTAPPSLPQRPESCSGQVIPAYVSCQTRFYVPGLPGRPGASIVT